MALVQSTRLQVMHVPDTIVLTMAKATIAASPSPEIDA